MDDRGTYERTPLSLACRGIVGDLVAPSTIDVVCDPTITTHCDCGRHCFACYLAPGSPDIRPFRHPSSHWSFPSTFRDFAPAQSVELHDFHRWIVVLVLASEYPGIVAPASLWLSTKQLPECGLLSALAVVPCASRWARDRGAVLRSSFCVALSSALRAAIDVLWSADSHFSFPSITPPLHAASAGATTIVYIPGASSVLVKRFAVRLYMSREMTVALQLNIMIPIVPRIFATSMTGSLKLLSLSANQSDVLVAPTILIILAMQDIGGMLREFSSINCGDS